MAHAKRIDYNNREILLVITPLYLFIPIIIKKITRSIFNYIEQRMVTETSYGRMILKNLHSNGTNAIKSSKKRIGYSRFPKRGRKKLHC